jgi:hypothetical protein
MQVCDKCGKPVPPENDAANLDVTLGYVAAIFAQPRHLLPTDDCEGSPSRAQYIEGQPKDTRSQYPYENYWEKRIRRAYAHMQVEV